ncbi:hypothetical protein EX30DRAFT_326178 [Ascodesmis nigricans]|uniref:Phospholipid/glycerol acyltransferase domain-containing protein n=1 Tax=Ascodesmis nigricans TaxID=341454 RepID=A0A4S2N767_9PEZI|nr:hypothetical protein EX30DRAFT_326178 [Ascodesmis nigricans]
MADEPKQFPPMIPWLYDLMLWLFSVLVDLFFREVHPRGSFRIPRRGPIIFVAAPHANQFVDPLILMRAVRLEARRRISFLIAGKSMRRKFIGWFSRCVGAVPVERAQDLTKPGSGRIYMDDPENNPLRIRGVGTKFTKECIPGGLIVLPSVGGKSAASTEIQEVVSDDELVIRREFKGSTALGQLTGVTDAGKGTKYKTAPKVDQTDVYDAVFHRLNSGGCVGIFPEGGSHDRTELLPLKAGVAIMALGALAANPNCNLRIVPVGMNYFHAHKFRSRAVIEFGVPIEVPSNLVDMYREGHKREAVQSLLEIIYNGLMSVTVTSPDYDTLMLIQAARRLYKPAHKKTPLSAVVELNRRLVIGYTHFKDDPRIVQLRQSVSDYNRALRHLGLRDHQVEYAKFSIHMVLFTLFYRVIKLVVIAAFAFPGFLLFSPVFVATKIISRKKAAEALRGSTVKIQARDVMATWKLLVALAFAPLLYNFYTIIFCYLTWKHRFFGMVPDCIPILGVAALGWIIFPTITFAALRFGEIAMDIIKSLRPLLLCLNPTSANTLHKLRDRRAQLSTDVTSLINDLGPEIFPDFDAKRNMVDPFTKQHPPTILFDGRIRRDSDASERTGAHASDHSTFTSGLHSPSSEILAGISDHGFQAHAIPKGETFNNLGEVGIFASRPSSRGRSRSGSSGGFPLKALSGMDGTNASFEEVSRKIKHAMKERRHRRRKSQTGGDWEEEEEEIVEVHDEDVEEEERGSVEGKKRV